MKIKSLLISAALMTGMCAAAQSVSAPDLTVDETNAGLPQALPLTLTMPDGGDYTNVEVHFQFPEGLYPCMINVDEYFDNDELVETDADGMYTDTGADVAKKGRNPAVSYSDNFEVADRWPNYTVVGANMSKTASTTNPNHFLTIFVKGMNIERPATLPIKVYMKYTQYDDQSFTVGEEDNMVDLCNVIYNFPDNTAVADVNAAKAVSSVKYYNAAGVASDNAFEGVNIVVTKYADGSQSVTKVVK